MVSPRGSNGGGEARWSGLVALPDFGSRGLSASTVIAYVAVGAAAILSRSVEEAARDVLAWVLPRNGKAPQSNGSLSCPLLGKQRTHMFSFLKRRRSPKQRIERTVRFVGEQDGPIERRLKADLENRAGSPCR